MSNRNHISRRDPDTGASTISFSEFVAIVEADSKLHEEFEGSIDFLDTPDDPELLRYTREDDGFVSIELAFTIGYHEIPKIQKSLQLAGLLGAVLSGDGGGETYHLNDQDQLVETDEFGNESMFGQPR